MPSPLLRTKTYIPPLGPALVSRPRLIARLNEGLTHKLSLISAPAGSGKTTLLSEWVRHSGRPVAWLSLDEGDNDPARFLAYLIAALQTVHPDVGKAARVTPQSPQASPSETVGLEQSVLTALINEIAALPIPHDSGGPCILVLDDYHLITTQPIHDALIFLLDHLPPTLHLVIATRADPPLPIARLRGRDQLTELRQSELRFTHAEAAAFLNMCMGLDLSPDDIAALETRTEGWIAGLQMASLAVQARYTTEAPEDVSAFIHAFTGSDRYILDYLVEEVLDRQLEPIRTFLLQTSILNRLSGSLCDAVTGPPSGVEGGTSQAMLERLEHANLFIIPLDNERRWYRYHRLFVDLLRRRLQQSQPALVATLHRRAGAWFEAHGMTELAIEHVLHAGDFERAADLITQVAEATLMRSELATFLSWVDALPESLVRARPMLCLFHAWIFLLTGRPLEAVQSRLQDADRAGAGAGAAHKTAPLHALLALYRGQIARAIELALCALEQLPEDERFLRDLATWVVGLAHLVEGDLSASTNTLDQAARISHQSGNVMMAVMVLCNVGHLRMQQGQLNRAKAIYEQALIWATDAQGTLLPIAGDALIGLGRLAYQWNDLEAAARDLSEGIALLARWGEATATNAYISLAYVRLAQGDIEGCQEAIQRAQQLALKTDATELDDILVAAHQAYLWVMQGNLDAALRWLAERGLALGKGSTAVEDALSELKARIDDDFFRGRRRRTIEYIVFVRLLLAQERPDAALALLKPLLAIAEHWGLNERVIRFQILRALAFWAQEDRAQALDTLAHALSLAEAEGYVRLFVDEGEAMARLLYRAAERGIMPEYAGQVLAAFPAAGAPGRKTQPDIVEPLSEREMEVLARIAEGLSNQEIAQRLFISERTVKWHSSNIYGKLGVKNRTQAVAKSRALGLL